MTTISVGESDVRFGARRGEETGQGGEITKGIAAQTIPIEMVRRLCPAIVDYGPQGRIDGWHDLLAAAVVVRSMLGVSPSAYQDAGDVMGKAGAAVAVACVLERAQHIRSAGGVSAGIDVQGKARAVFGIWAAEGEREGWQFRKISCPNCMKYVLYVNCVWSRR